MQKRNKVLQNTFFYCEHLEFTEDVNREVQFFYNDFIEAKGVTDYIQGTAFADEQQGANRTYLVRDNKSDELVAYFSLKTGLVAKNGIEITEPNRIPINILPGIEMSYFGVNQDYINKHPNRKGCGLIIFNDFIVPIALQTRELVGSMILYAFSIDTTGKLLEKYLTEYKFKRLPAEIEEPIHQILKPNIDGDCLFIYQQL